MIPTDKEMLQIVRTRLAALEDAAEAFLNVMKETGEKRQEAHDSLRLLLKDSIEARATLAVFGPIEAFLTTYEVTMPTREAAFNALVEALMVDFKVALICDPGTTEAMFAHWIPLCETPDVMAETTS